MKSPKRTLAPIIFHILPAFLIIVFSITFLALLVRGRANGDRNAASSTSAVSTEPWTEAQTVKPADLVKEMAAAKGTNKPVVVCAGVRVLYEGAHVPGAVFHGPASTPQGMADLKKWAQGISRSSNMVVYCGCCPFDHCPNIRPAFEALRAMGFRHLRVLVLPNNFYKDWYSKGYPYDKGK